MSARFRSIGAVTVLAAALFITTCIILGSPLAVASLPRRSGTVAITDRTLSAPVRIARDSFGVPVIEAANRDDAYFAQGYVHAQDRFFQMEIARRTGNGELAELFGEKALESDIFFRTLGVGRVAQAEYEQAEEWAQSALEAYSAGVNAYVSSRPVWRLGYEFLLLATLGNNPEVAPWTPADSLVWGKVIGATLAVNYEDELLRLEIVSHVGREKAAVLFPDPLDHGFPSTVRSEDLVRTPGGGPAPRASTPAGRVTGATRTAEDRMAEALEGIELLTPGWSPAARSAAGGVGSNAWVVAGDKTSRGLPLLANDPHLEIQIPPQFYETELAYRTDQGDVRVHGHSFPGVPGIVIGRNTHVAWGMTTAYVDEQDLFVEAINVDDPSLYRVGEEWRDIDERVELVHVAGEEAPVEVHVQATRNGPLISRISPYSGHASALATDPNAEPALHQVALGWVALEPGTAFSSMVRLTEARSAGEVREALRHWTGPAHNVVFADTSGTIGYQLAAVVPDRGEQNGLIPAGGWLEENRWRGTVEFETLPHVENPPRGIIVSANNAWAPAEVTRGFGTSYLPGYRALRVEELLKQAMDAGPVDTETMQQIQLDVADLFAERLLIYVRDLELLPEVQRDAAAARDLLLNWDREMRPESAAAALFARFLVHFVFAIMEDEFPADLWQAGAIIAPQARIMLVLEELLADPLSDWWDDQETSPLVEQRDQILTDSLAGGWRYLRTELGDNPAEWSWAAIHRLELPHLGFGNTDSWLTRRIFTRGPFETPGGTNQVNRNAVTLADPDRVAVASAFRMIADMSDWSQTLVSAPAGQSGHVASRLYNSETNDWIAGRYRRVGDTTSRTTRTLVLAPTAIRE